MAKAEFCHGVSNAVKGDREERRNGIHNSQFGTWALLLWTNVKHARHTPLRE